MITRRKELFIQGILKGLSATEAAKRAGYKDKSAYCQGSRLTRNVEVKALIDKAREEECARNTITDEGIVSLLWKEARTASRSSDRTSALTQLAKIRKMSADNTLTINQALFTEDMARRLQALRSRRIEKEVITDASGGVDTPKGGLDVAITSLPKISTKIENSPQKPASQNEDLSTKNDNPSS